MALLSAKDLDAKIVGIGKSASELQADIQIAAVNAIGYSIEHGDIRFGQKLFDAMPKGMRRQALITFLEKHGQFAYMSTEKKFAFYKVDGIVYDEPKLLATPWAEAKAENLVSEVDVESMFENLMKRLDGVFKKHEEKGITIKNSQLYDYLQEARDRYNTEKFTPEVEVAVA